MQKRESKDKQSKEQKSKDEWEKRKESASVVRGFKEQGDIRVI